MSDYTGSSSSESDAEPSHQHAPPAEPAPAESRPSPGLISSASAPSGGRVFEVWTDSEEQASQEPDPSPAAEASVPTIELTAIECRVLGSMIEKSFLTPDIYPMTTNAMVTACNQKTNRDPVVDYSAVVIDTTLMELRERNLVRRVHSPGSRSTKHRQTLDESLALNERQLALVSVLLLRGPQTIGELRIRTERHDVGFDDLEAVERCLETLSGRSNPLVKQLPRQPGHKENRWQHLLIHANSIDDEHIVASHESSGVAPAGDRTQAAAPPASALTNRIEELETQVATLQRQLSSLADKLGEPLE